MNSAWTPARQAAILVFVLLGAVTLASTVPGAARDTLALKQLLTREEQAKLGISSMSPEKREAMRGALIRSFREGHRAAQAADHPAGAAAGRGVAETQLEGDFKGWEGQTIIKLIDGQIWQQIEYHYEYHYAYMQRL